MELFNSGSNKFSLGFNEGGLPFYNTDISNLQDNAQLWGVASIYRDYNLVLSGCLVDELNLLDQTITITEGFVMIDNAVFKVPSYTGSYPVMIKLNDPVISQRDFKSGEPHDSTITYSVSYTTNITTNTVDIIFNPFCQNRIETFQKCMNSMIGEVKEFMIDSTQIKKTDTGKTIKNGSINLFDNNGLGLYNMSGWEIVKDGRVLQSFTSDSPLLDENGELEKTLKTKNIPRHYHELDSDGARGKTTSDGKHYHNSGSLLARKSGSHRHLEGGHSEFGDNESVTTWGRNTGIHENGKRYWTNYDGSHKHYIDGNTGEISDHFHTLSGQSGGGAMSSLSDTPEAIDLRQPTLSVLRIKYIGFANLKNHTGRH